MNIPLRSIPADKLERYGFKALTTWGGVAEYKYFLPRILELSISGELCCELGITFGKLEYGEIERWPSDERAAIERFVLAAWCNAIENRNAELADAVLCGASKIMDIASLLDHATEASPQFVDLYRSHGARIDKKRLTNAFWDRGSCNYRLVVEWLYGMGRVG